MIKVFCVMSLLYTGISYADIETERYISKFMTQMNKANEFKVPQVEKLKYISPAYFENNLNIRIRLSEVDNIPFHDFKILNSYGPYVYPSRLKFRYKVIPKKTN